MLMNRRLRLGRHFGVEIRVDWSWGVTLVVAAWTLAAIDRYLMPELGRAGLALVAALTAAGLFVSLGAHEIVRVIALRGCGVPVRRLTLFVLGGVTDAERTVGSARAEATAAVAAPLASILAGAVLALGVTIPAGPLPTASDDLDRLGAPGIVLGELALANVAIALLSLLPAFPLDGGRLLRAVLWKATGDLDRATRLAAWSGQIVGWSLVLLGIGATLVATGLFVLLGVWTCFAGWFIASAAAQGYEGVVAERRP